ncbi:MAG: alpha/beta hydrolase [Promethearchaeota archaeon]|jgi:acetyl esterase/lipase
MKGVQESVKLRNITITSFVTIFLNLFSIALGISYFIISRYSIFWDIFGVILIITLFENLLFIYFNLYKKDILRGKTLRISYGYLVLIIVAFLFMMLGNLLLSVTYSNSLLDNLGAYCMIYISYFGILIYGITFAIVDLIKLSSVNIHSLNYTIIPIKTVKFIRVKRILLKALVILSKSTFIVGIVFAVVIIFGSFEVVTTLIAIISGQFGIYFSFIFAANTILLLKLKRCKRTTIKYYRTAIIGLFVSGCLLMPLFLTNSTARNANKTFTSVFGGDWQERIPITAEEYFLKTPFTLTGYFLGAQPKDCIIQKNILFYDEEGIQLYFDAYMPLNGGTSLPGENSTIIRIHGGSWVSGDKGMMNMLQVNKYFAAQGYVVFDIQYGLDINPLFNLDPLTPDYKKGNFNIDDMLRHIGAFTHFLSNHSEDFGVNLNSVFVSGGSAGGQLASATGLAIASGNYTDIFSANLTIKGIIPLYPANGAMKFFGIGGSPEFKNPENLINADSPPCLIFQGTHDILNYFGISETFKNKYYAKGNKECAILWMPYGGHASDLFFSGYYNQIFLYFMERFLFLYH